MRSGTICFVCILLVALATAGRGRRNKPTILTYNTALLDSLGLYTLGPDAMTPSRTARRDAIIEKLKKIRADVLCLQEAWYGEDLDAIIDELKPKFPYSFSALHDVSGSLIMDGLSAQPACPSDVFLSFVNCVVPANCQGETTLTGLVMCINSSCSTEFMNLPQACWTCFIANGQNFTELALKCTDTILPGPYRKMNDAGLVLLSRRKMRNQAYVNLHPSARQVLPRGYIEAEVNGIGQVVCAHTSVYDAEVYFEYNRRETILIILPNAQTTFLADRNNLSYTPYHFAIPTDIDCFKDVYLPRNMILLVVVGRWHWILTFEILTKPLLTTSLVLNNRAETANTNTFSHVTCTTDGSVELQAVVGFTNYIEQGTFELNTIVERFSGLKRVLLPGDFNTGPACPPDVSAEFPGQFAILANAFNIDLLPQCTFCNSTENAFTGVGTAVVIDHIFFKGYRPLRMKRIFDDITIDGFPLSDHFGVIQQFKCLPYRH